MKTDFTPDWQNWINTNMNAGQDPDGIFKILLDEGYEFGAIAKQMNYQPTKPVAQLINPFESQKTEEAVRLQAYASGVHHSTQEQPAAYHGNNGAAIKPDELFVPNAVALDTDKLDLRTVDNFLSPEECEKIITRIKLSLRPSSVANFDIDTSVRTSRTCDLNRLDDDFIDMINDRICQLVGIDNAYGEELQGQFYEVGQEFKAHTDYFEVGEFDIHCKQNGQRTYTAMIYLNDVEEGGETRFRRVDAEFKPLAGQIIIWNSLNPDGTTNINSLHQAKPVEKGYKAVITKWFRTTCPQANLIPMMRKTKNEFVPNYTQDGIFKTAFPKDSFETLRKFYHENKKNSAEEDVPGDFIVTDGQDKKAPKKGSSVVELTASLREEVHQIMKPMLEDWSGVKLEPTYVYGIREYHEGAILKMHRDRIETHIISVIVNVDQDTDVDWPLVIEDNYYRQHHVMLKPGEMVFYEGARLIHGRPIAFEGNSFANIFCHFKPAL